MNMLVFEEFERMRSPENFWGVMVIDVAGFVAALVAAFLIGWIGM